MQTITFTAPTHWACALMYGDASGLSAEDEAAVQDCIGAIVAEHGNCHVCECIEEGFHGAHSFDYNTGNVAGDMSTYTIIV